MENLNDLKYQENILTARLEMLSDKLAANKLDADSKALLIKRNHEAMQERIRIRRRIQELEITADNRR